MAASYLDFFSVAACGLLSIPIAVAHLSKAELGIWAIVNGLISYLVWLDLGLGTASARMIAPSIAERHQAEINRWWTLSRGIMVLLGLVGAGFCLLVIPLFFFVYDVPAELASDTRTLLLGAAVIVAVSIPLRGVSGLFTAQGRYHWSPLLQAVTVWVNLVVFYLGLKAGLGLVAYLWAMAASLGLQWIAYWLLIRFGPMPPRWDASGFETSRARSLMRYSLNIAGMGFAETIINRVPTLLLGAVGGLGLVPLLHITMRAPLLVSSLVRKTLWSFYPGLLRLHVSASDRSLPEKHRQIGELVLCVGLMAAGATAILNKTFVVLLAGETFYAGDAVTLVLVALIVMEPLCRMFQVLLNLSGNMGRTGVLSFGSLAVTIAASYAGYRLFGMPGLLLALVVQPLVLSTYGILHGIRHCGYAKSDFSYGILSGAGVVFALSVLAYLIGSNTSFIPTSLFIFGFELATPSDGSLFAGITLGGGGMILAIRGLTGRSGRSLLSTSKTC
jgi:O-antigen/teichoic acid export membrane protein